MENTRTRAYRDGVLAAEGFPLDDVSAQLEDPRIIVWVDLLSPDREQVHLLAEELDLHELAVEDALGPHQRPKLDHYDTHLFLSTHAVGVDPTQGELIETEVDAFISDRWLVTVRKNDAFSPDSLLARWDRSSHLTEHGVSFLLYGLLDVIVDAYFDAVEVFDAYYDDVSEGIFAEQPLTPDEQRRWFRMRQSLVRLHRLAVPMREAISALMRREQSNVPDALYPYYQDVYDHILRISESTDALRDLVNTIVETNLSLRDYRQNLVMKKVTSWAAIIAVPTLITGYYGMNVPYPGSGEPWGAALSGVLVVALSATLWALFRWKDWL